MSATPDPLAWEDVTLTWPRRRRGDGQRDRHRDGRDAPAPGVHGVDLVVRPGEHVAVVGPSGAGKSTLLRLAEDRDRPRSGRVLLGGVPVADLTRHERARAAQSVPQDAGGSLTPWRPVGRALDEALRAHDLDGPSGGSDPVADLLDLVGLPASVLRRRPTELSGGQRQRVALVRALVLRPRVLLGDEMLSALDLPTRAEVGDALVAHASATGTTLVTVTHDLRSALVLGRRLVVLDAGRVRDDGPTEALLAAARTPEGRPDPGGPPSATLRALATAAFGPVAAGDREAP